MSMTLTLVANNTACETSKKVEKDKNDEVLKEDIPDETFQENNDKLDMHITNPGHEFNDKEILDKNADA